MKKIGVISDTHGLMREEVLNVLLGCDLIIHAGDIGSIAIIETLNSIGPVRAVRGNIDKDEWCYSFPTTDGIEIDNKFLYVLHNLEELNIDPKAAGFNIVISGHSHKPLKSEKDDIIYLNPGSVGPRRFNLPISMAIIELENENIDIHYINIPYLS